MLSFFYFLRFSEKMKISSSYGSFFFSFSSTETLEILAIFIYSLLWEALAVLHLALCAVHCAS